MNEGNYQETWEDALEALLEFDHLWTNPAPASDHTTQAIGLELVAEGYATVDLMADGYARLSITNKGRMKAQQINIKGVKR